MTTFARRRRRNAVIIAAIGAAILVVHGIAFTSTLAQTSWITGWTLLTIMVILAAYNARKKLPFLPLVASATWLQFHLYLGLVTVVLFAAHVRYAIPTGNFERLLALLYVLVAGSGVVGLFFTRILPPRLNRRGENLIYERLPGARRRLRSRAEEIVVRSVEGGSATLMADFYRERLLDFFSGPRHFWHHAVGSNRPRHALLSRMDSMRRYLNANDREGIEELAELVRLKDDLDYRHMGFSILKGWLFVHVPATYALLILAVVHLVLVHAFSGGA